MNLRALAANIIKQVASEGRSLTDSLQSAFLNVPDVRDQSFLQALTFGVCRWYFRLEAILALLLEKPLKEKDQDIHALLLVGLYQLIEMRVPKHAAVAETVSATLVLKKKWAKSLVNGVLRNYLRREAELTEKLKQQNSLWSAHPDWLVKKIKTDWPANSESILTANNQYPPFSLRVNVLRISRMDYLKKLSEQQLKADSIPETHAGITLAEACDVKSLPGFKDGLLSVQDGAAQLVTELLQLAPNQTVLDACAAPGGKTAHILECEPTVQLTAVDQDEKRLQRVRDTLNRLQLSAKIVHADAANTQDWWDGQLFDRILLDAPCSASGVIRRHPDIKLLRRASDIAKLEQSQWRLLNALWPLLKPNGLLVYATCSIFSEENFTMLQRFLAEEKTAVEEKIDSTWGKVSPIGKQILPGMHGMDGFYFACLRKKE